MEEAQKREVTGGECGETREESEARKPASDGGKRVLAHLGVDQKVETGEVEEGDDAGGKESG